MEGFNPNQVEFFAGVAGFIVALLTCVALGVRKFWIMIGLSALVGLVAFIIAAYVAMGFATSAH